MTFRTAFASLSLVISILATGCATTATSGSAAPCGGGKLMDRELLVCVPVGFTPPVDVPEKLASAAPRVALFDVERKLEVKKDAVVSFDPLLGMIDDDVLFGGAFAVAGHHAPEDADAVVKTTPIGK